MKKNYLLAIALCLGSMVQGVAFASDDVVPISTNIATTVISNVTNPPKVENPVPVMNKVEESNVPKILKYTGLVLEATGLDVATRFSPCVKDTNNRIVYGNVIPEGDYVIKNGMMDYLSTDSDKLSISIGKSRAGNNPLTIKVSALDEHNTCFIISKQDADNILIADSFSNFISKNAVVVKY